MGWLKRWDERNQRTFDGVISERDRQRWRWKREPDGSLRVLGIRLDEHGVRHRFLRTRFWPWSDIAYLTWAAERGGAVLAVCVRGDPWVKELSGVTRTAPASRALLEDAREFVEQHGARIRATTDPAAAMWWVDQPEARRNPDRDR